jgi:hypothetical protein
VLFQFNSIACGTNGSLCGGAETSNAIETFNYNTYRANLVADSAANPANSTLATAVQNLPGAGTVSQSVTVSEPYANIIMGQSSCLSFDASGTFESGCGQSYAAVVTVSSSTSPTNFYESSPGFNSTASAAAEHELDEVLGGGGAGTTLTNTSSGPPSSFGPMDFYRYQSGNGSNCSGAMSTATNNGGIGTRSWTDATSSSVSSPPVTCYSIDGGAAAITDAQGNPVQFNQSGNLSDYADFAQPISTDPNIQDAYEPSESVPDYTLSSVEVIMMDSIGYDSVPEPQAIAILGGGLALLALTRRKRRG